MTEPRDPGTLLREEIDARLRAAPPMPDPADVFDRARRLRPEQLDELDDEHALAPFIEAYRHELARQLESVAPCGPPRGAGPRKTAWAVVLAAAAVVLLVGGALTWLSGERRAANEGLERTGQEAQHEVRDDRRTDEATFPRGAPARSARPARSGEPGAVATAPVAPAQDADAGSEPADLAAEPADLAAEPADLAAEPAGLAAEPAGLAAGPAAAGRNDEGPAPRSLDERLAQLDARAQAAWRRGDLRAAERRYRQITKLGGRREVVELAYGELFAIVRQRGGSLPPLWRAYLRRFPRGRYAEDVEAGLCRRASSAEREACWARYRRRYPNGIHGP